MRLRNTGSDTIQPQTLKNGLVYCCENFPQQSINFNSKYLDNHSSDFNETKFICYISSHSQCSCDLYWTGNLILKSINHIAEKTISRQHWKAENSTTIDQQFDQTISLCFLHMSSDGGNIGSGQSLLRRLKTWALCRKNECNFGLFESLISPSI